jgi:hypothetical protein
VAARRWWRRLGRERRAGGGRGRRVAEKEGGATSRWRKELRCEEEDDWELLAEKERDVEEGSRAAPRRAIVGSYFIYWYFISE